MVVANFVWCIATWIRCFLKVHAYGFKQLGRAQTPTLARMQLLTEHILALLHSPVVQSLSALQVLSGPHLGQVPPPQSTSVSLPFFSLSLQVLSVACKEEVEIALPFLAYVRVREVVLL